MRVRRGMHLDLNDARIEFDDGGDGPPLVLLHGFTGTRADWDVVFDVGELRRAFRVIAADQRGHGRSTTATWPITYARCAKDVVALLDHLGIESALAIGSSLGGKTLLHVATSAPERVAAMIVASSSPRVPEPARALMRGIAAAPPDAALRARHGQDFLDHLPSQIEAFAADRTDLAFTAAQLSEITARTLIVHGDRDALYPVELAVELYRAIPRASLWVAPGAGHDAIFAEARTVFAPIARAFLQAAWTPS